MITNPPFSLPKGLEPQQIRSEAEARHHEKGGDNPPKTESYEIKALLHELEVHQIELEIQKEELELAYEQQSKILEAYSDLYDFSPVGYLSLDLKGKILNLNLRAARILDQNRSELASKNFYLYIESTDRHRFDDFLKTLPPAPAKNSIEVKLNDLPHFVELEGFITAEPQEIRLVMTDRTRARTSEGENLRLMTAIEGTADTIVITDQAANILYVNHAFEVATGYSKAEALGQNPRILNGGTKGPEFYEKMWETLKAGKTWRGTFQNKMKDGTLVEEEAGISPILNDQGTITHYVAVKRNIMQIRSLEAQLQQAQKMEAVGRLAGGVAHDFNNLLMAMMGYCDLCEDQVSANHPAREYLTEIKQIIDRASDTTSQLLIFARKKAYHPVPVDLNERVSYTYNMLQRLLGESFDLVWEPVKGSSYIASIDPVQIDQILANLCLNAKDSYKEKGAVTLKTGKLLLSQEEADEHVDIDPGPYVWISVTDKGSGMTEEIQRHIFEPFYTTKGIGKGTGLGLAIIYGIVKQNQGFVQVISQENVGTTFTILLPEVAAEKESPPRIPENASPMGKGKGETILVVDDEASIRDILSFNLRSLGYDVCTAIGPKEALALQTQHLESDKFRLVLSDIMMPEMTGIEMARLMKQKQPDLPIVFMTGHIVGTGLQEMETDHPEMLLHKPFTRMSLANKLSEILAAPIV